MINRYSLTDYTVTITPPEGMGLEELTIGGVGTAANNNTNLGTFLGSITVNRTNDAWNTDGDVTGSWVHNQNRSKVGTVSINIKQVSDDIVKLHQMLTIMEASETNTKGCTIVIANAADSNKVLFNCYDCYIVKMPDYVMAETAAVQTYTFTCGQVTSEISK